MEKKCYYCKHVVVRAPYAPRPTCGLLKISVENDFYCKKFKEHRFQPSFQKITILFGGEESGKTVKAIKMCVGKKHLVIFEKPIFPIVLSMRGIDLIVFEEIHSMKEVEKIIKAKLPVKEIIICLNIN